MHMRDALLFPAIGDVVWSKTAALTAYNARQVQTRLDNRKIPPMGILGAFVFSVRPCGTQKGSE